MTVLLSELHGAIESLLKPAAFDDYCPNGLQVEGAAEVRVLVAGVTASQALLDRAIELGADAVLVHHGYFWKGEDPCVTGMKQRRLKALLQHDISLLAYHLPLDAHPEYGNNAQLAKMLGLQVEGGLQPGAEYPIGNIGRLVQPQTAAQFAAEVAVALQREPLLVGDGDRVIERVAWCTGGAQSYIEQAAKAGVDLFLSGEISEPTAHIARELGVHYLAAGHHATERYGVKALAEYLSGQFDIELHFVDIDNPA